MPELTDLSYADFSKVDAMHQIATELKILTAEIKAFREAWEKSPQHEINALMLGNLRAQIGANIMPAGGIIKPNH